MVSNSVRHGSSAGQMFATQATTSDSPTHQTIHTAVGAKFICGSAVP